jgi:uncharacterized surface protein with fasciclin (FAS1) repeats
VDRAGLAESLNNAENITLFLMTNDAFAELPVEASKALMNNPEVLTEVLHQFVVPETITP